MIPKKIDDCEVIVDTFRIFHSNCIGPKKFDKYMMLSLHHNHNTDKSEFGIVDVFLTKYQALDLIKELSNMIATNDLLYPEDK